MRPKDFSALLGKDAVCIIILFILTFAVFSPALNYGFINLDDPAFLLENPLVRSLSLSNIVAIFQQRVLGVYIPLTTLSFAVEYHFFGYDPFIFHFTNILLHTLNVIFLFLLAKDSKFFNIKL